MNNSQFRNLILDKDKQKDGKNAAQLNATPSSLGTKKAGFIPMTPRNVKGGIDVDFAQQVRERNAALQPTKKYKSANPKGVKYGAGYTDRAKARAEAGEDEDDKGARIKALEEQMKLGQISEETFESLRDQITGGEVGSTHLVKGLDRQLLERVRRGEDVLGTGSGNQDEVAPVEDVDEELDKLGEKEIEAVKKEKVEKKGNMAPPSLAGRKRTRDELMAELKAQRKAAAEARAAPVLGGKWRRVGDQQKGRIEIDSKGREVLITVDEDGVVKKKVRKAKAQPDEESAAIAMPDANKGVLGADVTVPEAPAHAAASEDEDDDIFEGVGTEYNPLGNEDEDEESDSDVDEVAEKPSVTRSKAEPTNWKPQDEEDAPDEQKSRPAAAPRNYFKDTAAQEEESTVDRQAGIQDLLKKAAKMDPLKSADDEDGEANEAEKARLKRRAELLAQKDRDMDDIDMAFGGGRYDDEGDGEEKKMRLSEWKGGQDEGWEEVDEKGGKKKRKPKKRKGDANNAADIMRVIEGRKSEK